MRSVVKGIAYKKLKVTRQFPSTQADHLFLSGSFADVY